MFRLVKFGLIFISVFSAINVLAQEKCDSFRIVGKWNVCYPTEVTKQCQGNFVSYVFKEDGTFKLFGVKVDYADNVVFDGIWKWQNKSLILEHNYETAKSIRTIDNIIFISRDEFYTVEEPLKGWQHYTKFQKAK